MLYLLLMNLSWRWREWRDHTTPQSVELRDVNTSNLS
jgi:hypothetical protein